MQPLQRSYAITAERIEAMLSKGSLSSLYDQSKVDELENAEELTGKDQKKLETYRANQPVYEAIIAALNAAVSEQIYNSPAAFMPVLTKTLSTVTADKKLLEKIADTGGAEEKILDHLLLTELIKELKKDERKLLYLRYFADKTQTEIGEELGISQVQVSRMEKKILKTMREHAKE